ncbi:hypothetical protein Sjap_016194 [Stephania japonica]|uniref:Pescadillo homolog n=1 Tax=Stephania japonica TaxID=461633 RepID=A0AAP0NRM2_9MAGN
MPKHYRPAGKKKEGNAAKYITRSKAVKYLQISLQNFRKLCILKGIHPHEPKKKVEGTHKTYYLMKDIAFLAHEPILEKLRDIRAYDKKVKKARVKKNEERAKRLLTRRPSYTLDRVIKERYPKFIDALRDLDDCLTMVHLFAALPSMDTEKLAVQRVHNCRRLSHEWQAYISRTHSLRKTFISVKGIYYQAEVEGQKITWLTPHSLQQIVTDDVDFNVMLTFLEFYENLLAFINFKLYHSINVKYPPILDSRLEALAADLYALSRYFAASSRSQAVESADPNLAIQENAAIEDKDTRNDESELRLAQLQHQLPANEPGTLMQLVEEAAGEDNDDEETKVCRALFKDLKFFLGREVPRESLLFIIPAFGGVVSWEGDGAPYEETDKSITHQIVDRPSQKHSFFSRDYVQPQWIFDCVNARIILPTDDYLVGRVPPPHLSPFVENEAEGYAPDYAKTIKHLQAASRKEIMPLTGVDKQDLEDSQSLLVEGIISRTEATEAAERKRKMAILEKQYHDELKMELKGVPYTTSKSISNETDMQSPAETTNGKEELLNVLPDPDPDPDQIAKDASSMSTLVMSRRKRRLYEAMQIGKERKEAHTNLLKQRKKKAESSKKSA